jgi:hypothetical protein
MHPPIANQFLYAIRSQWLKTNIAVCTRLPLTLRVFRMALRRGKSTAELAKQTLESEIEALQTPRVQARAQTDVQMESATGTANPESDSDAETLVYRHTPTKPTRDGDADRQTLTRKPQRTGGSDSDDDLPFARVIATFSIRVPRSTAVNSTTASSRTTFPRSSAGNSAAASTSPTPVDIGGIDTGGFSSTDSEEWDGSSFKKRRRADCDGTDAIALDDEKDMPSRIRFKLKNKVLPQGTPS